MQLHATDGARAVSVILLEERSPPLHEVPECREAKNVHATRARLVKHVCGESRRDGHLVKARHGQLCSGIGRPSRHQGRPSSPACSSCSLKVAHRGHTILQPSGMELISHCETHTTGMSSHHCRLLSTAWTSRDFNIQAFEI